MARWCNVTPAAAGIQCRAAIRRAALALGVTLMVAAAPARNTPAADSPELRNWFDDPYFQVRSAIDDCPVPLGPLTSGEEMRTQAHNRGERGTRCFEEGRCRLPNSFLYDKDIAEGGRAKFAASREWRDATLWVTVQRRIVWIEGCVAPRSAKHAVDKLERLARAVPDVELAVVNVRKRPGDPAPYRQLPAASRAGAADPAKPATR